MPKKGNGKVLEVLVDQALELDEEIKEKTKRLNKIKAQLKKRYGHGDIVEGSAGTAIFYDAERRKIEPKALFDRLGKKRAVFFKLVTVGIGKVEKELGEDRVEDLSYLDKVVANMKLTRKEDAEKVIAKMRKDRAIDF